MPYSPEMKPCIICSQPCKKKYCSRSCQNKGYRLDHPERYAASREKYNQGRNQRRQADPEAAREQDRIERQRKRARQAQGVPEWMGRILARRDPETKRYG